MRNGNNVLLLAALILCIVSQTFSYVPSKNTMSRPLSSLLGYKEMLAASKAGRGQLQQKQQRPAAAEPATSQVTMPPPAATAPRKPSPDGLPFDDEMYDNIKYAIDKITGRVKSPNVLTTAELQKFENAILAIIADSKGLSPPPPQQPQAQASRAPLQSKAPPPVATDQSKRTRILQSPEIPVVKGPDRGDGIKPTSAGHSWQQEENKWSQQLKDNASGADLDLDENDLSVGSAASWSIPGMETMSKDEYYAAINKRVAQAKALRKASGEVIGPRSRDLYEESLNSRRNEIDPNKKYRAIN